MSITELSLVGKKALVTGGRRGIGKAIALAFANAGADVAVCDLIADDTLLQSVAVEIQKIGRRSLVIQADTSRKSDVDSMVREIIDQFGVIDILVNNAGVLVRSPLLKLSESDWDKIMDVDLKGYFLCAQTVGRKMVEIKNGNIINISTQQAFKANMVEMGAYGIAKAGVVMMTRYLARELGEHRIRVNGIAPGLTRTEFSQKTWMNEDLLKNIETSLPLGRIAEVDDIADTALFLASDAARYITGHTILMEVGGLI